MTAATQQAGLTADERSEIRRTVLDAREKIESDLRRQLQRFGIYEDEKVPLDGLGHLDASDRETRETIDAALEREMAATGGDYERSVTNYVREATKTHLNRLVALKTVEARGLVTETLTERAEYGNRSEMLRAVDEVAGELTDRPDGGVGVALDLAYTELTDEIGVIFEESEHTAIDIDFAVREEVIDSLNDLGESVWKSDEAMGWVYQYFGENEREEIDERIDEENYKVQDTDVATKTQLFTPRYIVEWMVDNSLGRLWLEMHGDGTDIDAEENCFYLAPLEESLIDRDAKDVRDIKVLDPACGSGHMLFYAFDVLYEMYLEQGDVAEKYIPREILKNNLYGIDIDPGAAQLAALSLYVKAKSEEPDVEIEQINIVSADAVLVNGEKKEEVLARADTELEKRVLEQVWRSFEHIREWGSLVRIEERIEEIIEEELEEVRATGQTQFTEEGLAKQSSVASFSNDEEESWEQVKERLLSKVSKLAEEALERNDPIEEMFVGEVEKSVRLLDIFIGKYDVVVSNPPYLGSGKMGEELKKFVKDNYKGSRDLYTAFIERNSDVVVDEGYVSMITMETFMYLYSFRGLRAKVLNEMNFVEVAHLENRDEGYMNVCYTMRKSEQENHVNSKFNRLINTDDNISGLKKITEANQRGEEHDNVYVVDQNSFLEIQRTPFLYWFGQELLQIFIENKNMAELADVKQGLSTGNDERFMRKHWEIPQSQNNSRYVRFQKSGTDLPYYDTPQDFLDWADSGSQLANYEGSVLRNEDYYFEEGLTVRPFGELVSRKAENLVFGKPYFIMSKKIDHNLLNGLLNSSLYKFLMNGINPSVNVQVGDVNTLPVPIDLEHSNEIISLVHSALDVRRHQSELIEASFDFEPRKLENHSKIIDIISKEKKMHADLEVIQGCIDEYVFDSYNISKHTRNRVYDKFSTNISQYPHILNSGSMKANRREFISLIPEKTVSEEDYKELITKIDDNKDNSLQEICEDLKISPYTVAKVRQEHNLYTRDEKQEAAGRLLSYFLGCAMGRWEHKNLNPDDNGIIVFDSDFEDDVMSYMRSCIELTYGEDELYDRETEIEEMLNKSIEDWLRNTFFRYHHCKEYRRRGQRIPIYWQLESDEGTFSCFVYYHAMDGDTLPKLRGQYVDVKLDTLRNRLDAIESELDTAEGGRARDLRSEKEDIQADIDDISEFRDRLDDLIDEGFEPDFEAGIWENIQRVDEHDLLAVPLDKL